MGCTESKEEAEIDVSIGGYYNKADPVLRDAVKSGNINWSEKLHTFESSSEKKSEGDALNEGKYSDVRNVVSWTPGNCNIGLNAGETSKKPVKGILLICHGVLAHGIAHREEAVAFAKEGYAVYTMDHYGHGLSSGPSGWVDSYDRLVEDIECMGRSMMLKHSSDTPVVLLGHSLGSIIACNVAARGNLGKQLKAVIFSGCPFKAGPGAASLFGLECLYPVSQLSFVAKLGACMARIDPTGPTAPLHMDALTSDGAQQKLCEEDPRRAHMWIINITAATVLAFIDYTRDEVAKTVSLPSLLHHGADDTIAMPLGSQMLFDRLATPPDMKSYVLRENMKHEYSTEKEELRRPVIASFIEFANKHCSTTTAAHTADAEGMELENVRISVMGAPNARLMVPSALQVRRMENDKREARNVYA